MGNEAANQDQANDELAELVHRAVEEFGATCFWNVKITGNLEEDLPTVFDRLCKHGGMLGLRLAAKIRALAGEDRTSWR